MNHTVDSLIDELKRLAAGRGWGGSLMTNVSEIEDVAGLGLLRILSKEQGSIDDMVDKIEELEDDVKSLKAENRDLQNKLNNHV